MLWSALVLSEIKSGGGQKWGLSPHVLYHYKPPALSCKPASHCQSFLRYAFWKDPTTALRMRLRLQKKHTAGLETPSDVYNRSLALLAIVASGGAVIFGFELAFISGVFSLPSFRTRFGLTAVTASHLQTNVVAVCKSSFSLLLMNAF